MTGGRWPPVGGRKNPRGAWSQWIPQIMLNADVAEAKYEDDDSGEWARRRQCRSWRTDLILLTPG